MKNFSQAKNEPLIDQFEEINEELSKKNKELEIILMVIFKLINHLLLIVASYV